MDKDEIYLGEIKEFCQKIIGFTADLSYEQFLGDEKLQLAVVKLIENIGEASKTALGNMPHQSFRSGLEKSDGDAQPARS